MDEVLWSIRGHVRSHHQPNCQRPYFDWWHLSHRPALFPPSARHGITAAHHFETFSHRPPARLYWAGILQRHVRSSIITTNRGYECNSASNAALSGDYRRCAQPSKCRDVSSLGRPGMVDPDVRPPGPLKPASLSHERGPAATTCVLVPDGREMRNGHQVIRPEARSGT